MISWTFCRPYRSSMSGGNSVETNERPGTASQTRPSCSAQEVMAVNPFTEILSVPTKQCRALNLWITSSSPFPARLRRFFELLQPCGRETRRQLDPPPKKKLPSLPTVETSEGTVLWCCVKPGSTIRGPVKRHAVTTRSRRHFVGGSQHYISVTILLNEVYRPQIRRKDWVADLVMANEWTS